MVMDKDRFWSWELSDQEKLYQGMREGRKHDIRKKGKEEGRTESRSCQISLLPSVYLQ